MNKNNQSKNPKITIATCVGFGNHGAEALLRSRIAAIRKYLPNAKFSVLSIYTSSCQPIKKVEYIQTFGGQREKFKSPKYLLQSAVEGIVWTFEAFRFRLTKTTSKKAIRKFAESDIFISTDGDILGEDYGLLPYFWRLYYLSLGFILKKPVVIYAEGLGPFKNKFSRWISKLFFNKCRYISVRDGLSYDYVTELGISKEVNLVADSAFLLEPSDDQNLNYKKPNKKLIGVAVSELATKYGFKYQNEPDSYQGFLKLMSEIIDWMSIELNADIILIPHVTQISRDDHQTAQDILNLVKNKQAVKIISKEFNASQLKKIISHCDLLVASRMHAIIAGVSSQIPVIGIAYSHKLKGLFNTLGLKTMIDIEDLDWNITEMIKKTIESSEEIKKSLEKEIPKMKKLAEIPAEKVAEIINGK